MLPMIRLDPQDLRAGPARRAAAGASPRPEAAADAGPAAPRSGTALDLTSRCTIVVGPCWPGGLGLISALRRGRRPARRWPGPSGRSGRDGRGSAAGPCIAWVRRWRAQRRSAARIAGGVAVPTGWFLRAGHRCGVSSAGALTWSGKSRARPWYPVSTSAATSGWRRSRSSMPSVRSAVTSCIRPGRSAPSHSRRPRPSLITVDLIVFCFFLPDTNARRPGRFAAGRPGDRGPVHPVEHRQRRVRQLEPQDNQGGDHPVSKRQLMIGPCARGAQPVPPTPRPQPRLLLRQPHRRQLLDQPAKPAAANSSTDTMRQGRTGPF